jgi:hypothetical protein
MRPALFRRFGQPLGDRPLQRCFPSLRSRPPRTVAGSAKGRSTGLMVRRSQGAMKVPGGLLQCTRPLSHRPVSEIHDPVWGRAIDEFSDKGAPDIVLLNRAKRPRNQTPQPGYIARCVSVAGDNARTKNRQTLEAYRLNRLFLQPHHPRIANPAFRGASRCREQRKPCDAPGLATAGKTTNHADFEGLQFLFAPLQAAFTDANTGCPVDRVALCRHALRKPGHFCRKLSSRRIQDHLPHTGIRGPRNRPAIDHHDFSAGRLCSQRAHHGRPHLPRAADDQDTKCHFGPFPRRTPAPHPTAASLFPSGHIRLALSAQEHPPRPGWPRPSSHR